MTYDIYSGKPPTQKKPKEPEAPSIFDDDEYFDKLENEVILIKKKKSDKSRMERDKIMQQYVAIKLYRQHRKGDRL